MNVLIVTDYWPTKTNPITGIFVVQQAQAYSKQGHSVVVIAPQPIGKRSCKRDRVSAINGVKVYAPVFPYIPSRFHLGMISTILNPYAYARAVLGTLKRDDLATFQPDFVHIQDFRFGGLSFPIWGKNLTRDAILTIHGVDRFLLQNKDKPWLSGKLAALQEKIKATTIVGKTVFDYALQLGIPSEKIYLIHNGTDIPEDTPATLSKNKSSSIRTIISVSNISKTKGVDINLHALATIKKRNPTLNFNYIVIGDGLERRNYEQLAKDLGLSGYVRFLGRLPYETTMEEVAKADIFSLPSWVEAFGLVFLEAMARRCPVIGCLETGAAEIIRDNSDGYLVRPRVVEDVTLRLENLLLNPTICRQMGENARFRAESFSWERNVTQTLSRFGPGKF